MNKINAYQSVITRRMFLQFTSHHSLILIFSTETGLVSIFSIDIAQLSMKESYTY